MRKSAMPARMFMRSDLSFMRWRRENGQGWVGRNHLMVVIVILRLSEVLRHYRPRGCQEAASSRIHQVLLPVRHSGIQ